MATRDDLVPCAQSEPFNDLVGSSDRRTIKLDVGHIGLAMGGKGAAGALARGGPLARPAQLSGRHARHSIEGGKSFPPEAVCAAYADFSATQAVPSVATGGLPPSS